MAIDKLYISHHKYKWKSHDTELLEKSNFKSVTTSTVVKDYHTSLEDLELKLDQFENLISSVNSIHLVEFDENTIQLLSDRSIFLYLNFFKVLKNSKIPVYNFEWYSNLNKRLFNKLIDTRHSNDKTLWVAGCSFTAGDGVTKQQRYASLLSEKLQLPLTVLATGGSSIAWQADQILQSDLKAGDILVWGLTSFNRINYANGFEWKGCTILDYLDLPKDKQYWNIDFFDSMSQSIPCIKNILQVVNICKKIGVELYLVNLLEATWVDIIFGNEKNYLDLTKPFNPNGSTKFIDLGTDNQHPGPLQHQEYAEQITNLIKENYHGNH